jgi:4-amino-4-deoxy-L-arabinose transferase-like glycosyltransferase
MVAQPPFDVPRLKAVETRVVTAVIGASLVVIGVLAINRQYFTFGTEIDFLHNYLLEAQRVLTGAPLELYPHPPLYPIVLAHVWRWVHDWFLAGLLLSWLAALVSLASVFWVFLTLYGRAAAWGSLVGLCTSRLFVTYAASATTEVFFLAFVYGAVLVSLLAAQTTSTRLWGAAGLALGLLLLTRGNAVSFLTLLALPLLQACPWRRRLFSLGVMGLLGLLPLAAWGAYAAATGSPVWPTRGLTDNLALTYFGDRDVREGTSQVTGRFANVFEVLAYQPRVVASLYLRDLAGVVRSAFRPDHLLAVPLNLLAFPGLILLVCTRVTTPALAVLATLLVQVALVNCRNYDARLYLFLVPLLGAAAGMMGVHLYHLIPRSSVRRAAVLLGSLWLLGAFALTVRGAQARLHAQDAELSAAAQAVKGVLTPATLVVARRARHLAYYTGSQPVPFPKGVDLEGLHDTLQSYRKRGQVLLYFGSQERRDRPHLSGLASPATAPHWLKPMAHGSEAGGWVLYRLEESAG